MKKLCQLTLLVACLMCAQLAHAQVTHEKYYEMYAGHLKAKKFTEAITSIQKLLDKQPGNPVCLLFMAMAYEEEFYGVSMYQGKDMEMAFSKTKELFAKASDNLDNADYKEEFKAGAPAMEEMIGTKPNKKNVDAYIAAHIAEMAAYYDKVKAFMQRLDEAEKVYIGLQEKVLPLVLAYKTAEDMHRGISDAHWQVLDEVIAQLPDVRAKLEAIKADEASAGIKPEQMQDFQWAAMQADGRNLMKLWPNDFRRSKPSLFDMAKWAKEVQEKAQALRDLRNKMQVFEEKLANGTTGDLKQDAAMIQQTQLDIAAWKQQMLPYDEYFVVERMLDYYIKKANYQSQAKNLEERRKEAFIHREKMEELVKALYVSIDTARVRLYNLVSDSIYYESQMPIYRRYGGKEGIENFQKAENQWLLDQRKYWGDVKFYAASLLSTIPDKMPYKGKNLLLRPANFDPAAAYSAGDMVVDQAYATNDALAIVVGRYKNASNHQQPFVAKFGAGGEMLWMRDFMADSLDGAAVAKPYSDSKGNTGLAFYFDGANSQYRFELIGNKGETLLYKHIAFLPEAIHPIEGPDGFLLVAEDHHDIETLHLQTLGLAGEPGTSGDFTLNGQISKIHLQPGKARIILNYISLKNDKGINLASKAGKGTNIAIITLKMDGTPVEVMPIDSPFPIATDMLIPQGSKLLLKGRKGNYHWNDVKRLEGGEPWEMEVE